MTQITQSELWQDAQATTTAARPFLKWVGGKGQLLGVLMGAVERAGAFGAYHEPFVGGGALFFELRRRGFLGGKNRPHYLSDVNVELMETYRAVRDFPEELAALLRRHATLHCKDYYYAMRAMDARGQDARVTLAQDARATLAARMIYLNKTCFNGLYRVNARGQFNVSMGRYVNPTICDEANLRACSAALAGVRLIWRNFTTPSPNAAEGDLVYFDPPYVPVSGTAKFREYASGGFGEAEQHRLACLVQHFANRGVKVMASNSDVPLVRELYKGLRIDEVQARRSVNCKGGKRGVVGEVLVTTF